MSIVWKRPRLPKTQLTELTGDRITLRPFLAEDVSRRSRWPRYTEPEFSHLNVDLNSPQRCQDWYRQRNRQCAPFWFALGTFEGRLIGEISLREVDHFGRTARLGIHLASDCLDQGYGTEGMRLLLKYYFDYLKYNEMKLDVAAFNRRAMRCYEKLGFKVVGSFWRMHPWSFEVLSDARCEHLRPYVRLDAGLEVLKHWEMSLTEADYRKTLPQDK